LIYPTRAAVLLAAAGAPVALLVAVALPGRWYAGLAWPVAVLVAMLFDALSAPRGGSATVAVPSSASVGADVDLDVAVTLSGGTLPASAEIAIAANAMLDLPDEGRILVALDKGRGLALLRECLRILKPGGTMRVTTPDLDWLSAGILDGSVSRDLLNSTFYEHGHAYIYSRAELLSALGTAGFSGCTHFAYKDPDSILGFLDSHADRFDHDPCLSQYVEARRPA